VTTDWNRRFTMVALAIALAVLAAAHAAWSPA
jgi:hypothetical protein